MSSAPKRLLQTDSFRHAALYAGLFGISMLVLIVAICVILDHSFKTSLLREVDDDLMSMRTAYATAKPGKAVHEAAEIIEDRLLAPDADDVFLLERGSQRVAGNLPAMAPRLGVFTTTLQVSARSKDAGREHTILGQGAMLAPGIYAFVGRDLEQMNDTERSVLHAFAAVLVISLVLASGFGVLLSRTFMRRIDAVAQTCRGIMAGRLGERIATAGRGDEFDRLVQAINDMLDRIQDLMESLRQVSTDIAHDMRTPLTHLQHRLERVRGEARTPEEYAAAVDSAVAECDALLGVFTALLRIAQIEAGARRSEFRDVDLAKLVATARDIYGPVMDDAGRAFRAIAGSGAVVRGDEQLLLQLLSNLLNNVITHTPAGSAVDLGCAVVRGYPVLTVTDHGEGIPAEDRDKVLRRFYRREQSRTKPGSGLGLALVAAVAELHEADLVLNDGCPGLQVEVRFRSKSDVFA